MFQFKDTGPAVRPLLVRYRMDVLVYAGPEVHSQSMNDVLSMLRSLLLPRYSIQTLTPQALKSQPWSPSCALLVFPQFRDVLPSPANSIIREYVESGGAFLGFGFGAQYITRGRHERSTADAFNVDKTTSIVISPSLQQEKHSSQEVVIATPEGELIKGVDDNRSNGFVGFEETKGVTILAKYNGDDDGASIAGLACHCGRGMIALWAPNLEIPLKEALSEQRRLALLKSTLLILNLQLPHNSENVISHPLPQYLTSHPSKPTIVSKITDSIAAPLDGSQLSVFEDKGDTFHFHRLEESESLMKETRENSQSSDPSKWQPKHIILCRDALPDKEKTPLFDLELYYKCLSAARKKEGGSEIAVPWGMGEALLYGEAVTSTQTLLEK
jgi:biotin---protein ligase